MELPYPEKEHLEPLRTVESVLRSELDTRHAKWNLISLCNLYTTPDRSSPLMLHLAQTSRRMDAVRRHDDADARIDRGGHAFFFGSLVMAHALVRTSQESVRRRFLNQEYDDHIDPEDAEQQQNIILAAKHELEVVNDFIVQASNEDIDDERVPFDAMVELSSRVTDVQDPALSHYALQGMIYTTCLFNGMLSENVFLAHSM